jgi:hypothetical protein
MTYSATAPVKLLAGTAAAPGATFTGDTDTGLFSPGANQVAVTTGGVQRLLIGSDGSITPSGSLLFPLGSATAPSISFTDDLNTGLYSPGADQVAVSTGGTGRLFVDASGNVGIGQAPKIWNLLGSGRSLGFPSASIANLDNNSGNYQLYLLLNAYRDASGSFKYLKAGAASQYSQINDGSHIWYTAPSGSADATITLSARLIITSAGLVGIGTTSPSELLHVSGNARATHFLSQGYFAGQGNLSTADARSGFTGIGPTSDATPRDFMGAYSYFYGATHNTRPGEIEFGTGTNTAGSIQFKINTTERLRIDSSGRLLVGTSTARSNFDTTIAPQLQIESTSVTGARFSITRNADSVGAAEIFLGKTRSSVNGGSTAVLSGDSLGGIAFWGADGTNLILGASINGAVDGTPGANDMPGRLVFSTTADGASTPTERLRIDSAGQIEAGSLGTAASPVWTFLSDPNTGFWSPAADTLAASTGGSERLRIDSSGRLLVGTSTAYTAARPTAGATVPVTPTFQFVGSSNSTDSDTRAILFRSFGSTSGANRFPFFGFVKSRGTSVNNGIVELGDGLGGISFQGTDGTQAVEAALITAEVDGTPGANDMPGRLVFSTTADGAASPTERMRITSAGVLQVADAGNITVGTTTGTKIGTATTQKLGFFDKTPVVQPIAVADATTAVDVITQFNALLARMRDLGLIAT